MFATLALTIATGLSAQVTARNPAPSVELVAICDITADGVKAWSAARKPLSDFAQRLENGLSKLDYSTVNLRVGRKNRWLAFRGKAPNGYSHWEFKVEGRAVSGSLNVTDDTIRSLQIVSIAVPKKDRTVDVTADIVSPTGEFFHITPRPGSEFTIGKASYRLGDFAKSEVSRFPVAGGGEISGVPIGSSSGNNGERSGDQSGSGLPKKYVWTAIAAGPAPALTWGWNSSVFGRSNQTLNLYSDTPLIEYVAALGAIRITSNVDPESIGLISCPITEAIIVEFRRLPLDP